MLNYQEKYISARIQIKNCRRRIMKVRKELDYILKHPWATGDYFNKRKKVKPKCQKRNIH